MSGLVLARYLYREIGVAVFGLLAVLLLIVLSNRFIRYLAEASMGHIPSEFIFKLLALKLLTVLGVVLPLAFFLAILLSFGRLYVDNEMTAMAACGVGTGFFLRHILWLSLLIAVPVALVNFWVGPWAMQKQQGLQAEAARLADLSGIAAGRFKEFSQGRGVFYVEDLAADKRTMRNVFVAVDQRQDTLLLTAERAYQRFDARTGDRLMVLEDGQRYSGRAGEADFTVVEFAEHTLRVRLPSETANTTHLKAVDTATLWNSQELRHIAELQLRISAPLAVLLLGPLAVLMAYTTPRQGRYLKAMSAILVYFIYGNMLEVAQKWVERGTLPAWLGVWWVHGLVLALLAALLLMRLRR